MSLCLSTASAWQEAKVVFLENKIWDPKVGYILQLSTSFIFKEAFEMKNSNSNTIKYNRSYNRSNKTNTQKSKRSPKPNDPVGVGCQVKLA